MNTNLVKPVRHGDQIEIDITSLAFGGDSVGRYQDFAIFVAGGLPGERVRVRITQVKDHYAVGEILAVLKHSPDRVVPNCAIFEECGGCQWQHFNYPVQLKTKRQFVVDALKRIGKLENITVQPCLPSPSPYNYRNKAMPVLSMRDGHFISGIYEPRSHHLVPYQTCPIQAEGINAFIQKVLKKIDQSGLTPYQEKKHSGFLRHLAVRQGAKTGEILLAFVTRSEVPEERVQKPTLLPEELDEILPRIARELMEETPGLVGVLQNINPSRTNIVFGPVSRALAGRDHYFEVIDGLKLKVSLKSFLQVNTEQADILHTVVREALGDPARKKKWGTILDLYSGIGTLALAVSERADYVVGVEEIGAAVEDAKINAELNHRGNIDFLEGDVSPILLGLRDKGLSQVDAVIVDPPRKGVLPEVLARVTALHPERLVYVSCDPSTLARDLALLTKHGYAVDWAQPLDMFPQTYHVETVVRLTREKPLPPEVQATPMEAEPFRLAKPMEPQSLNLSANFHTFQDKTGRLFEAIGQQLGAAFGLMVSLVGFVLRSGVDGARAVGRGAGSLFKGSAQGSRQAVKALEQLSKGTAENLGKAAQTGAEGGVKTFRWVQENIERTRTQITTTLQGPAKPSSTQTPSQPFETTFIETLEEETTTSTVVEEVPQIVEPTPEISELSPVMEEPAATGALPVEEVVSFEEQVQVSQIIAAPKAPVEPPPAEERAVAPVAPLPPPPPKAPKPPKVRKPLFPQGLPLKQLRWALVAALLAGGGVLATAKLSPDAKRADLLVPMVTQMVPDIIAVMPTRNYLRYELVPFEVRVNDQEKAAFPQMNASVQVYRNGEPVTMVDNRSLLTLKRDMGERKFAGNWPIPYNPLPGTYVAEVTVHNPKWDAPKVFQSAFTISPLKPSGMPPGYAVLTMEGGKQLVGGAVPALDGDDSLRAANAMEWTKFMGANMYCFLMGQTSLWDHLIPRDFPFSRGDMEVGKKYAKLAHENGLKFAGYMTTFKVVGDAWAQAPYQFSLGYDPESDEMSPSRFISVNDPKRRADIVHFLQELDKDSNVDAIGMDYVRMGDGGYDLVDDFVKDLDVALPEDYSTYTKDERILWLAESVSRHPNARISLLFQWWRAHKVALTLKSIFEEAKVSKPIFTFTLGWEMGHQHGQDPAMYIDAGVNYNHIMLYEGDRGTLASMKRQWPQYLARCNGQYAPGEMVDFNWVQKSLDPPGPEELYNREADTFQTWFAVNSTLGMFWHDLYRIVYGVRGPYSSMEWAVSGGKAFTTMQRQEGLVPIEMTLVAPKKAPAGVAIPLSVEIRNHSPQALKGVVLHQVDTTKNYYTDLATVGPFDLPSGNMVRVKNLTITLPKGDEPDRDNRYMAAVFLEKPGQAMRVFDFAYLKKVNNARAVPMTDGDAQAPAGQ